MTLAGFHVSLHSGAMDMPEIIRHQDSQRFSNQFLRSVTKDFLRRAIDEENGAAFINGKDCI